ncbi:hypothetical protein [Mucilaginibacter pineti]|nr:hypothetical protein [Mucilaginibacter pineti]
MKIKAIITFLGVVFIKTAFGQSVDSTLTFSDEAYSLVRDTIVQKEIRTSLVGFLDNKNKGSLNNPFIDSVYLKKNMEPFSWLIGIEIGPKNAHHRMYPVVLAVVPVENSSYLIKLAYMEEVSPKTVTPNVVASLIVKKNGSKYYFYNPIDHYTRLWGRQTVGTIDYIYPNALNMDNARQMDSANKSIARKFNTQPLTITYYKFDDPEQLFKTIGFDFIPNMYYSTSGGLAEQWTNTVLAGNNSELYIHEVVHFYTSVLFPGRARAIDEGYATYLGGSGGVDIDKLAVFAKNYIKANPQADVKALATDLSVRVEGNVPITYILSGLICRDIEQKYGVNGIKKFFGPDGEKDYFKVLYAVNKVDKKGFASYVNELLKNY